jgi:hypothetical protein
MTQPDATFIERLKALACEDAACQQEDFKTEGVDSFAGGNIDDAYGIGLDDGEIILAREVLTQMGIKWD